LKKVRIIFQNLSGSKLVHDVKLIHHFDWIICVTFHSIADNLFVIARIKHKEEKHNAKEDSRIRVNDDDLSIRFHYIYGVKRKKISCNIFKM